MSSKDDKMQSQTQKLSGEKHVATAASGEQSSTNSKSTSIKPSEGNRGFRKGSLAAVDPTFVDVPLHDEQSPEEEGDDYELVEFEAYSSRSEQRDDTWKYAHGLGKEDQDKDVDSDYEEVEKPGHSAYSSHPDHPKKYGKGGRNGGK